MASNSEPIGAEALRRLAKKKPVIDEANCGWTGRLEGRPILLVGDRKLYFDHALKTMVLDTRKWLDVEFSDPQLRRSRKFHEVAGESGRGVLI